ncbi:MAG: protein kinase domain-containing protein, partial [Planctomycetota bacterium]
MAGQKDRHPIEVLAAEFVDRHRRGEHPTVEEYAEQHPDLAREIHDLFPTILAMERLKKHKESSSTPRKSLLGPSLDEQLGDYILLREIGRGGMGIVYEAEQESLGRRVAVKVLPRQALDEQKKLQRFQREAQTAAKLHHTNIVPIFGVGEQDGFHYYVMQFIPGLGLDAVLRAMKRTDAAVIADDGEQPTGTTTEVSSSGHLTLVPGQAVRALRTGRFQSHQEATSASQEEPLSSSTSATVLPTTETAHVAPTGPDSSPEGGGTVDDASVNGDQAPASDRSYWRSVAKVGAQVGDALHYAHGQGTLHRDIKPANLILDAYGVVWVTDFGLAKAVEHAHLT